MNDTYIVTAYVIILSVVFRTEKAYVIDSIPYLCANMFVPSAAKRYMVSVIMDCYAKDEPFFGFRLHFVCTSTGIPVAFDILPASWHDLVPVQHLTAELPALAQVVADKAYISDYGENLCYLYGLVKLISSHGIVKT